MGHYEQNYGKKLNRRQIHIDLSDLMKQQAALRKQLPRAYPIFPALEAPDFKERLEKWNREVAPIDDFRNNSKRTTVLCCILAQDKNKLHIDKMTKAFHRYNLVAPVAPFTMEDQATLIDGAWREYALEIPEEIVGAAI